MVLKEKEKKKHPPNIKLLIHSGFKMSVRQGLLKEGKKSSHGLRETMESVGMPFYLLNLSGSSNHLAQWSFSKEEGHLVSVVSLSKSIQDV